MRRRTPAWRLISRTGGLLAGIYLAVACAEFVVGPKTTERSVRAIHLDSTQVTLDDGQTRQFSAIVLDQTGKAFDQMPPGLKIQWASSAGDVVSVDASGLITASRPGVAQVTASLNGSFGEVAISADVTVRPVAVAIAATNGNNQQGVVGEALPEKLMVRVSDRWNGGVPNQAVTFTVKTGGGTLSSPTSTTDVNGEATVAFTLGTAAGAQTVDAATPRLSAVATLTATAQPGSVSALTKPSGDGQAGVPGSLLSQPLVAKVSDRYGNGIPGVQVTWNVLSGGGAVSPATSMTDASGAASAAFTLGPATGPQVAQAGVAGVLFVSYNAIATGGIVPVASVDVSPASVTVASGATPQLTATPRDAGGNALTGRVVTWSSNNATVASVDAAGLVQTSLAGTATITATAEGISGTASVTVTAGALSTASSLVMVSQPSVLVGQPVTLTLRTRDAAGNNILSGGRTVIFTATGGTSAGAIGSTTDNGDGTYGATFSAVTAGTPLTIGATVDGNPVTSSLPTVQVMPSNATYVIRWIDAAQGGNWSDPSKWDLGRIPGPLDTVFIQDASGGEAIVTIDQPVMVAKIVIGPLSSLSVEASNQAITVSDSLVIRPGGELALSDLASISGPSVRNQGVLRLAPAQINAAVRNEGDVFVANSGAGLSSVTSFTNVGTLTLGLGSTLAVTGGGLDNLGTLEGAGTLDVSAASGALRFGGPIKPGNGPGTPARLTVVGDLESTDSGIDAIGIELAGTTVGTQYSQLAVTGHADLSGAVLNVSAINGFIPAPGNSFVVMTHASRGTGFGSVNLPVLATGQWQVVHDQTQLVLTVLASNPTPAAVVTNEGDGQTGPAGSLLPVAPSVLVTDASSNPLAGVQVDFAITGGGGQVTGASAVTGPTGIATVGGWTLGVTPGANTMTATVTGTGITGNPVTFTATGTLVPVVPAAIAIDNGDAQTGPVGTPVSTPPSVLLTDASSNPVAGAQVDFAIASGGGSVTGATAFSDANGIATMGSWTLGPAAGANSLTATAVGTGVAGNPVTFTATGFIVRTWTGAISTDWSNPGNWSPSGVPGTGEVVMIVPAANQPTLTATSAAGSINIGGPGAQLTIGGQTLSADGIVVHTDGVLVMTNPADRLVVTSSAYFQGGDETGLLTAGELRLAGAFSQGTQTSPRSFAASGTHTVVMTGSTLQGVNFCCSGTAGQSGFQNLDISASAGINIQDVLSGLYVYGTFTSLPGAGPTPLLYGRGRAFRAAQFQIDKLVVSRALLILNEGPTALAQQFDNVMFQDTTTGPTYPTRTPLTVVAPGAGGPARSLTFSNVAFVPLTAGNTGHYVDVTATTGSLVLNLPGANALVGGNGPAFTSTSGAATVNWASGSVVANSPTSQSATVGTPVADLPTVRVTDAAGTDLAGVTVTFAVTAGGGSVTGATTTTNNDGMATVGAWTLGSAPGLNTLTATVSGADFNGNPVTFEATGVAGTVSPVILSAGQDFTCRLDGGATTRCWGANNTGQLGDGSTTQRLLPVLTGGGQALAALTSGATHACGLTSSGAAYCWGDNTHGEFGNGATGSSAVPVPGGGGLVFAQLTAGSYYTCGITFAGVAYCWGNNGRGNLGDGTTSPQLTPTLVAGGHTFTQISAGGDNHTCAVTPANEAYCWGYNFDGELGVGDFDDRLTPTVVAGGHAFRLVAAANFHTCALTTSDAPYCWGDNNVRQLGDGSSSDQAQPVPVLGGHAFQILATGIASCGLDAGGSAYCWGFNPNGQIGDGTTTTALQPTAVSGGLTFSVIAAGGTQTCARTSTGTTYCWGLGASGQIGDGTHVTRLAPVEVGVLPVSTGASYVGVSTASVPVGGTATLTLYTRDAGGYAIEAGGLTVTFTQSGGNSAGTIGSVIDHGDGTYTATFTATTPGTPTSIGATIGGTPVTSTLPTITIGIPVTLTLVNTPLVGVNGTATIRAEIPASSNPAGLTIAVASSNTGVLVVNAPASALLSPGNTVAFFTVTGISSGAAFLNATVDGVGAGQITVNVSTNTISVPLALNVPYTRTASLPINLTQPAPAGGTTIDVVSANPAIVNVLTPTVLIAQGTLSGNAQLEGVSLGEVAVTATGPNLATGVSAVRVTAALDVIESSITINAGFSTATVTTRLLSAGTAFPAPAGGIPLTFISRNGLCVTEPDGLSVPAGLNTVAVTAAYAGFASTPCSTYLVVTSPSFDPDSVQITVNPPPTSTFSLTATLAAGLSRDGIVFLGAASPPGGTVITITSSDPSRLVVAPNATTVGAASIDITVPPGSGYTYFTYAAIEGQAGTAELTATITHYQSPPPVTVTIDPLGIEHSGAATFTMPGADGSGTVYVGSLGPAGPSQSVTGVTTVRAGGPTITVTLTSTTPAVAVPLVGGVAASPRVVTIGPGQSSATYGIRPLASGTTTITATSPDAGTPVRADYPATITVTQANSSLNVSQNVAAGLSRDGILFLGATSPPGGTVVRLTSSDPTRLVLAPNATTVGTETIDLTIPAGSYYTYFTYAAMEGQGGTTASISGSVQGAPALYSDPTPVTVTIDPLGIELSGSTTFTMPGADGGGTVYVGSLGPAGPSQSVTGVTTVRAGGPTITVTLTSTTPAVAVPLVGGVAASPRVVTIGPGQSSVSYGIRPLASGTTTITATSPDAGTPVRADFPATITVTQANSSLNVSPNVAAGLSRDGILFLGAIAPPGGTVVRLTSSDPTRLVLAPNATTVGTETVDLTIPAGTYYSYFTYAAMEGQGGTTATISGSVQGAPALYSDPTPVTVTIDPLGIELSGSTTLTTLGSDGGGTVYVGSLGPAGPSQSVSGNTIIRAGGPTITVTLTSTTPTVAVPLVDGVAASPRVVTIGPGQSSATYGIRPLVAGTTTITATSPDAGSPVRAGYPGVITVTSPSSSISLPDRIGAGLSVSGIVFLQVVAPAGGTTITLTSSDPARLLLAPNSTTAGAAQITLPIAQGAYYSYFQAMALEDITGSPTITAQTPGFTDAVATIAVQPIGVQWTGPASLTTLSADVGGTLYIGIISGVVGNRTVTPSQEIRFGGVARTVTMTTSNPAAVLPVVGGVAQQDITATIQPGQSQVAVGVRPMGAGTATIAPNGPGLISADAPGNPPSVVVTVPVQTMSIGSYSLGAGLSQDGILFLQTAVPAGGRTLTLTSTDPTRLLLAPNSTTAGASQITFDFVGGSYYTYFTVMALEGAVGTAGITATISGYRDSTFTFTIVQPAVTLDGPAATRSIAQGDVDFRAMVGVPSGSSVQPQVVRYGAPSLSVTLTSSAPAIGTIVIDGTAGSPMAIGIPAGQSATSSLSNTRANFRPVSTGNATITATIPGFLQQGDAIRTVTVSP